LKFSFDYLSIYSIWITYWATNGLTSKFHLKTFTPSYFFQYTFRWNIWDLSCLNFIMFLPKSRCLAYSLINLFNLSKKNSFFSITLQTQLGLSHPSIASIPQCVYTYPINPMDIHFLWCTHDNECKWTHDTIHNTFITIVKNASFHVGQEQLHAFLSTMFNSSHQQINIVLVKITFTHSHLNWHYHCEPNESRFISPFLCNSRIYYFLMWLKPKKELWWSTPHWSIPPYNNWSIWMFTQKNQCVFT
jgi:hypothetical protein